MSNNKSLSRPIYFFTKMDYGNYNVVPEYDSDILGEENAEINYEYRELKTGKEGKGIAFYNEPKYSVNILAVRDSVNVDELGEGDYEINPDITYYECLDVLNDIISEGVDIEEISSNMIRQRLYESNQKVM